MHFSLCCHVRCCCFAQAPCRWLADAVYIVWMRLTLTLKLAGACRVKWSDVMRNCAGRNGLGPPSLLPGLPCARVAWAVSDMRTVRMPLPWESRCCERAQDPTGLAADCRRHCSRLTCLFVRRSSCKIGVHGGAGESSWSLRCTSQWPSAIFVCCPLSSARVLSREEPQIMVREMALPKAVCIHANTEAYVGSC